MERRLAAIVAADVVGYSRMIRADKDDTLTALRGARAEVVDPAIAKHNGRIVKLMGDGVLVEFSSAVDAVATVVEVQKAMTAGMVSGPKTGASPFALASIWATW
jgi:adenylate cyclase